MLKKQFNIKKKKTLSDFEVDEIFQMDNNEFGLTSYSKNQILEMRDNDNISFIIVIKNNKIIGYMIFSETIDFYEIYKINVLKKYRNNKIGTNLINQLHGKEIFIEVDEENNIAISFYKKNNFEIINIRKKYYSNGNNAIILKRKGV